MARDARGKPGEGRLTEAKRKMVSRRWTSSTMSYVAATLSKRSENCPLPWKSLVRESLENGWGRSQRKWDEEWHGR